MKSRLFLAGLSVIIFTMAAMTAPAQAAKNVVQDASITQLKADDNRIKKLRHGYIKYDGNKVYYFW